MYDDLNKRQTEREKGKKRIKKTQTNDVQVYLSFNAKSLVVFFIRLARNTQTSQDKTKPTRIQTTIDDLKTTIWPAFFFFCLSASYTQFVPMYIVNSVSFQIAHSHIYIEILVYSVCCWTCFSVGLLFCYISLGYAAAALCSCSEEQQQQQQHKVYEEHYNNRIFAFFR